MKETVRDLWERKAELEDKIRKAIDEFYGDDNPNCVTKLKIRATDCRSEGSGCLRCAIVIDY